MSGGILRFPWTRQPQVPTRLGTRAVWAFLPLSATGSYAPFEGGLIQKGAVASPVGTSVTSGSKAGALRGITPATSGTSNASVTIPAAEINAAFSATGAASVLVFCKAQSSAGHGSSTSGIFELYSSGSSFNHYPFTDGNIYVGPLSGTRYLNGTVSGATAGIYAPHVAIATATSGSQKFYVNGTLYGSGTAAETPAIATTGSGFGEFGSVYFTVFFDRVLSASEIRAYSDNPWQLFAPIHRTIWVPSAGGGPTYTLTAASGSFALTGQDAGLAFNRVLAADTQSYTLTGQTTGLAFNRTLAAASGSFTLTGQDAGLAFNRVLSAASGSYALDGQDVTLTYTPISGATYTLGAASGSFALTGQDTGLAFNRVLTADTQSYSLSGDVAGLAFNRVLAADTVSYALTGQDVALTYTSNGFTYTLTAESGSFEVTGQDASFRHTQNAIAGGGGWLPQTRRKSRKQIYEERVKLGILPPPVIKAAAKVAAVAQTVEEFKEERPKYEEMFLKAIKKTEWLPDYTRAIQAQLAIMEQEEEELLLLL